MIKDFKAFIMRGNVLDLAVGVIIGTAFGKIVTSLVNDIIMPPIGMLLGGVDFSNKFVVLRGGTYQSLAQAKADKAAVVLSYGAFINTVVEFLIIAFCVFLLVQQVNRFFPPAAVVVKAKDCPFCAMAIPMTATKCPHCTSALA